MVAFATAGHPPEEHAEIVRTIQDAGTTGPSTTSRPAARWAHAGPAARPRARRARTRSRFTYERWNGTGFPNGAKGEEIPLRDAHRARQPRHGGDRSPLLPADAARRRSRPPRPHVRPGARGPVRRERGRLVRAARQAGAVGRGARPRAGAAPACWRAPTSTRRSLVAADFIDLKSPYRAGHSRRCAQLAADAATSARVRRRRGHGDPAGGPGARVRHDRRSRTRSGTSPVRSRAPSSTGSSSTRCSPSRCSAARRRSPC